MRQLLQCLCALCILTVNGSALLAADMSEDDQKSWSEYMQSPKAKKDFAYQKAVFGLETLGESLRANAWKLQDINKEIESIYLKDDTILTKPDSTYMCIIARQVIKQVQQILFYQSSILSLTVEIQDHRKCIIIDEQMKKTMQYSKSQIDKSVNWLINTYGKIPSNSVLSKIDKSRDIMKDSVDLLNTGLQHTESIKKYCDETDPKDRVKLRYTRDGRTSVYPPH